MAGKKFSFRLAPVLRLRHHATEQARERLARATAAVAAQEAAVEAARRHLDACTTTRPSDTSARALRHVDAFRTEARLRLDEALRTLTHLRNVEVEARERLAAAHRDEEVLQTLHDQQLEEHQKAAAADEAAGLDEQALTGYIRQQSAR